MISSSSNTPPLSGPGRYSTYDIASYRPCPQCSGARETCVVRGPSTGHRGAYLIIVLVPYILLVLLFHSQLQIYDTRLSGKEEEGAFIGDVIVKSDRTQSDASDLMRNPMKARDGHQNQFHDDDNNTHFKVVLHTKPFDNHIQKLLDLDKQVTNNRDMFESRWNRSSTWSSVYPMSSQCKNASVIEEVPTLRFRPLQSHWVYTAYYDPRPSTPVVRVLLLAKKVTSPPAFHCHFTRQPGDSNVLSVIPDYYEMCENHAKDYGGWILSCPVPRSKEPPCEVTISDHSLYNPDDGSNIRVPVFRTESEHKQEFGVCIPPIFGYIPSTTLVEFVEMTRLLGASHFVFYAHQASREIQKVLQFYDQLGIVTVIHWDLPVSDKNIWYHGQLIAINDCLYRNMHRFKYVAFNDLDEFIVPHSPGARNWTHMIGAIEAAAVDEHSDPQLHCGYSFHSAFFDPLSSGSRVLYDLESDLRTKALSTVRTKTMVRPDRMFELGIHHISRPITDKYKAYYVTPNEAYIHHYRKCVTDFDPKMNCQVYARDETLSPYIPSLRHNVHQALWVLKEREKLHT